MHPYIPHLLIDIKKGHLQGVPNFKIETPKSLEEEFDIIDDYTSGRNMPPSLSHQCGLLPEHFPPADMLTEKEMQIIIVAFQEMLSSRHIAVDFPSGLPVSRAYPLLVGLLDEEAWFFPGGMLHFDFCTGYAPDCELKEYCPCLEHWNKK